MTRLRKLLDALGCFPDKNFGFVHRLQHASAGVNPLKRVRTATHHDASHLPPHRLLYASTFQILRHPTPPHIKPNAALNNPQNPAPKRPGQPPGDGSGGSPCMANSCAAETIRGMIDGYAALGGVRVSSAAQRIAKEEGRGGPDAEERSALGTEAGLPRLCQVCA